MGEKLDQLRGTDKAKSKKRGKKIQVPAGKSYMSILEDQEVEEDDEEQYTGENSEEEDEEDVDDPSERMVGRKKGRSAVVSSSESEAELPDPDDHVEDEDEDLRMAMEVYARRSRPPLQLAHSWLLFTTDSGIWPRLRRSCQRMSARDLPCSSIWRGEDTTSSSGEGE